MLEGEHVRLVMYRRGLKYGVVSLFSEAAVAADYRQHESSELRTLIGNEGSIIDWVHFELANQRFTDIAMQLLNQKPGAGVPIQAKAGKPRLQLVSSH